MILRILSGPNAGAEAALGQRTVVGSSEAADIVVGDPGLAPEHFTIVVEGDLLGIVVGDVPVEIGREPRSSGTFRIAPFDLIKFGSTCCAIGPESAIWPPFSPADLLPAPHRPPASAEPVVAEEAKAPVVAEPALAAPVVAARARTASAKATRPAAAPSGAAPRSAAPRRAAPRLTVAAIVVIVMLGALGAGHFLFQPSNSEASSESRLTAQSIIDNLQAGGVKVSPHGNGLIAEGFVPTNDQQRRLRQALLDADLGVKYRVVSLEQQVAAVRTIVSTAGAQITVEADPKDGKIVLEGFLPENSHGEALQRILQRDIPELRPLSMKLASLATVADEARKELASAGLKTARVDVDGGTIRISGAELEPGRAAVRGIVEKLNTRWSGKAKIEDATTLVAAPVAPAAPAPVPLQPQVTVRSAAPPDKFTVIVAGRDSFVLDSKGRRYTVGDKLANGEVIDEIRVEGLVTSRDGIKRRYSFGGGQ